MNIGHPSTKFGNEMKTNLIVHFPFKIKFTLFQWTIHFLYICMFYNECVHDHSMKCRTFLSLTLIFIIVSENCLHIINYFIMEIMCILAFDLNLISFLNDHTLLWFLWIRIFGLIPFFGHFCKIRNELYASL